MSKKPTAEKHIPVPKNTSAFICAECGAVSLDQNGVCKIQGKGTKADWCGTPTSSIPLKCVHSIHELRFSCRTCGKVSANPELLCQPASMA